MEKFSEEKKTAEYIKETVDGIKNDATYKLILKESFGGVLYNIANRGKYDADELMAKWRTLPESAQDSCGGIMKGVFSFLEEK